MMKKFVIAINVLSVMDKEWLSLIAIQIANKLKPNMGKQ
jgi:hypothetical protein